MRTPRSIRSRPRPRRGERVSDLSSGLQKQLRDFEQAVRDHAFIGAENPADWPALNAAFDAAKKKFIRKLWVMDYYSHQGMKFLRIKK